MSAESSHKVSFDTFHNVINNELVDTATTRHAICPSTEEHLWPCPVSEKAEVERAIGCAKDAQSSWRKLSYDERAGYLNKFADALEENQDSLTQLLSRETGKPPQGAGMEVAITMALVRGTTKLRLKEEKPIDDADRTATVRYVPLGVGVGIVPWNFPLLLGAGKLVPALLTGNTFIWKPSPFTPYTALKVAEIGARIFPPGVFQALSGEENIGPLFTAHPDIAKVSFTGSVQTGKKIMAACASTLKRVTLELGGNDAAIICEDVDIEAVAPKVAQLAFLHCGQICMDIKRIYVHEKIYDRFLAAIVAATKQLPSGDHTDPAAFSGALQNSRQYDIVREMFSQIGKQGWQTAVGGDPGSKEGKGYFMPRTIIDNPPEDSRIVVEEPFGPIVPALKWSDEADVIKRVNASRLGLGASVWSKDTARAQDIANQLEAGSVWVNTHFELSHDVPFGGHKESGIGMEWGELGLKGWCNPQAFWVRHK